MIGVSRFHDASMEPVLDCNVVPHLDDNIQLTVERYRDRIYASIHDKRTRTKRQKVEKEAGSDEATPTPDEATPTPGRGKSADGNI